MGVRRIIRQVRSDAQEAVWDPVLKTLHIKNLALVSELDIEFGPGLNVITGETGAGKSLILGALGLLLGDRARSSVIRRGAKQCDIAALISFSPEYVDVLAEVNERLAEAGASTCEDGELLLSRTVAQSGTRSFVNNSPTTLQVLRDIGEKLVDIHGPHEHQSLLQPRQQLALLDAFAGLNRQVARCASLHAGHTNLCDELAALRSERLSDSDAALLRHQLQEIESAELALGEDEELAERYQAVSHAKRILEIADQCGRGLTESDGSVTDQLSVFVRLFQEIEDADAAAGEAFTERLAQIVESLQDLSYELRDYAESLDLDQEEFQRLEERLDLVQRLKRRYGPELSDVLRCAAEFGARLDAVDSREQRIEEKESALAALAEQHAALCAALSAKRQAAASRLARSASRKLRRLGFADARLEITLSSRAPGATGADQVEFGFAPNPGEALLPLRQIASSGEMARVMLALKTVLSSADSVPVLVFDEVDANIGGRVAVKVAEELCEIGRRHQVFSITHLPQIAAAGASHYEVSKRVEEGRTTTRMSALSGGDRARELTRMLGASDEASAAADHARELLANARSDS